MTTPYDDMIWRKHRAEVFEQERQQLEKAKEEWNKNTHVEVRIEVGYGKDETYLVRKSDISRIKHYLMNLGKQKPA